MIKELFCVKFMLYFGKSHKRQKYVDRLKKFNTEFSSEFDEKEIKKLYGYMNKIDKIEREEMFDKQFFLHRLLKFSKDSLEVDNYNPEEYRTFEKFNDLLKKSLILLDYWQNLEEN